MKRRITLPFFLLLSVCFLICSTISWAEYKGAPRAFLLNPDINVCFKDTKQYKKDPPYVIGYSNAGLGDSWRVVNLHVIQKTATENKDKISKLLFTDANHDDAKQVADIQDLVSRGVDILIVSANTQQALDRVVTRVMRQGIPVVMMDRRIASDNFVTFVTGCDAMMGRLWAQWIVEKLNFKGNVIMLGGQAGSSVSENRERTALQVFNQYPDIKVLDTVYSDWSPVKGKQVMEAMIAKYGKRIDAVWCAHGLQVPGSIEAFLAAGYGKGEIPPHTTADLNGPLQLALKYDIPLLEIGYPPAMGRTAVEVALKVMEGRPVPCIYHIPVTIGLTQGDETASVRPDMYVKDIVRKDRPADFLIWGGMGPDYDPTAFSINYPGKK